MTDADPARKRQATRGINGVIVALAVIILMVVAFLAGRHYFGPAGDVVATAPGTPQDAGTGAGAAIGGPFALVDQDGRTVTDADFRGKYMLVYFGYTYCPDVCPTSLSRNSGAMELLGDKAEAIVPVLITVDPERDTPEVLKDYVGFFHPRLVALTGTPEQVAAAAKAYRLYFARVEQEGAEAGTYLMDHTSITYLMGPDGSYVRHFSHNLSAERMAEQLEAAL